jgi:hypothetical protein
MSWPLVRDVYATTPDLDSTPKAVLVALAFRANRDGVAWPTVRTLMNDTGLSDASVRRGLRRLIADGRIEVVHSEGRQSTYLVTASTPVPVTGPTPVTQTGGSVTVTGGPVTVTGGRRSSHEVDKKTAPADASLGGAASAPQASSTPEPLWVEYPDGSVRKLPRQL